jgi:hypothetical protein
VASEGLGVSSKNCGNIVREAVRKAEKSMQRPFNEDEAPVCGLLFFAGAACRNRAGNGSAVRFSVHTGV